MALVMSGVCAASLLAGCGSSGTAATTATTAAPEADSSQEAASEAESASTEADAASTSEDVATGTDDKTITVSCQTGVGQQESWEAVAKAYEEKHPDVKVDVDLKAVEGYDQWVQTAFSTKDPKADIVNINVIFLRINSRHPQNSPMRCHTEGTA